MNVKRIGSDFEKEFCEILAHDGYWVHFISPDRTGSQPFDIIAVKNGKAFAIDCKTCVSNSFNISRLEDNQIMAFEKWIRCGNGCPLIAIKHKDTVRILWYDDLKALQSVRVDMLEIYREGQL